MSDRELLELAAKAAGIQLDDWHEWAGAFMSPDAKRHGFPLWNPLTDDGDALRLAVKLGMHCVESFPVPSQALIRECGGDEYAATRRAIVRAAAEMGRNVP